MQAWLNTVLKRRYYDLLRIKYRCPAVSLDIAEDMSLSEKGFTDLEHSEEGEQIRRSLALQTEIYRNVLVRFYMCGESVRQIAEALSVSENTVKSRLDSGRKKVRKEFEAMEKYSEASYSPKSMWISCSGNCGTNDEPLSLVANDDIIAQNLLILAYDKPVTIPELSGAIGIAAAYIEPIVNRLISGELMKRTGDKVYTDFVIFTHEDRDSTSEDEERISSRIYKEVWKIIYEGIKELEQTDYYNFQSLHQKTDMKAYFALRTLLHTEYAVRDRLAGKIKWEDYPCRPNGGKWFAMGNICSEKPYRSKQYSVNGEYSDSFENITVYEYSSALNNFTSSDHQADLFYAVMKDSPDCLDMIDPKRLKLLDKLCENGYLVRTENGLRPDIPVLTESEFSELRKLSDKYAAVLSEKYGREYSEVIQGRGAKLPPHLKSVPGFIRHMWCANSMAVLIMTKAMEDGLFLQGLDHHILTAYIIKE